MDTEKILLSWEVQKEKKDSNTILLIIIVFIGLFALIGYYFLQQKYLNVLAFTLMIASFAWYISASPKNVRVAFHDKGFLINNEKYLFENFKSFWLSKNTGFIYFRPKGRIGSMVSFPSGTKNIEEIISYIPESIIEEEDMGDDFMNRISTIFKI